MQEQKAMARRKSMGPSFRVEPEAPEKKFNSDTHTEDHKRPGEEAMKLLISIVLWFNMMDQ
jgi:hypothetical protein